jgi:hypothetical protein
MSASACRGVWERQWEEDPIGDAEGADRQTIVLWTQSASSGIYVDVRLPPDSPGRSVAAAKSLGFSPRPSALAATKGSLILPPGLSVPDVLPVLCRQKSFAGALTCSPGDTTASGLALSSDPILAATAKNAEQDEGCIKVCTCFWRRDIDYQPPSGGLDVGVCASGPLAADGSVLLRETGEDGSYAEGWLRIAGSQAGPFAALELVSENGLAGARKGYWVRAGSRFAYAVGRPVTAEAAAALGCFERSHELASFVGKSLLDAASEASNLPADALDALSSYVAVAGTIDESGQWNIQCSTNPELVGCLLIGSNTDDNCCSYLGSEFKLGEDVVQTLASSGASPSITRIWKVVELQ